MKSNSNVGKNCFSLFKETGYSNAFVVSMILSFIDKSYAINNIFFTLLPYNFGLYGFGGYSLKYYKRYKPAKNIKYLLSSLFFLVFAMFTVYKMFGIIDS
jgi:hypothetical protein